MRGSARAGNLVVVANRGRKTGRSNDPLFTSDDASMMEKNLYNDDT
jgi:hypothetical protein